MGVRCRDQVFSIVDQYRCLDCVKVIQALLRLNYGFTLAIDGYYGPQTRAAVEEFQRMKGLAVDGVVGPETWAALDPPQGRRIVASTALTVDAVANQYLIDLQFSAPGANAPNATRLPIGLVEDTGAFECVLLESVADTIGLPRLAPINVKGVGGVVAAYQSKADVWIGDTLFENVDCVIMPEGSVQLWGARFAIQRGFGTDINPFKGTLSYYTED